MHKGFESLADIFEKDPGLGNIRKIIKQSDVVIEFPNIFPELAKVAKPVKTIKKTLYLKVENAAWRSELKFKETQLIDKINGFFKEERIKRIVFIY